MTDDAPLAGPRSVLPPLAVAPRRHLPGSRATLGGLLVAVAALLLFVAARPGSRVPSTRYLLTTHALATGAVVRAADLAEAAIDLPPEVASQALADPGLVIGAVVVAPLAAHQLVARNAIAPNRPGGARPVLSFAIDADRAAAGDLVAGDHIDLFVTWSHESSATTEAVGRDLTLVAVRRPSDHGLTSTSQLTLSVAVPTGPPLLTLVRAIRAGDLTVVRTTGGEARP